jgi:predicted house-cleaning noncanonical NTP pyrophosphatase (MazG superfamily)
MKMTKKFDKLNETFNVDGEIVPVETKSVSEKIEKYASESNDIKKDYEYARGNLYSLVEKGQEAINGMLELAQESEMPRAYEVLGQLIKTTTETTEKLMALHKIKKDVEEDAPKGPTTVNNALFVGSTTELAKLLKQQSQNQLEQ